MRDGMSNACNSIKNMDAWTRHTVIKGFKTKQVYQSRNRCVLPHLRAPWDFSSLMLFPSSFFGVICNHLIMNFLSFFG